MVRLIIRVVINAVALWVAGYLLREQGLTVPQDAAGLLLVAIVFGLVNALIKPVVQLLSCPLTMLTLGLFTLVINALMLMLTGWLTGGAVTTANFWVALLGAVIISVVSTILSWFLGDRK
jgi:putative membrane protein